MLLLPRQALRLHHDRVKGLVVVVIIDLKPTEVRLHNRVCICSRLHYFNVVEINYKNFVAIVYTGKADLRYF